MRRYNQRYYFENQERIKAQTKKWAQDNPERVKEITRLKMARYYKANPDKHRTISREWSRKNRDKVTLRSKKYRMENREKVRIAQKRQNLKRHYGISVEQYEKLQVEQKHCCAICRKPFTGKICVDHCHNANYVRGLLCHNCNLGIGHFQNSPAIALEAAHYLQKGELFTNAQAVQ